MTGFCWSRKLRGGACLDQIIRKTRPRPKKREGKSREPSRETCQLEKTPKAVDCQKALPNRFQFLLRALSHLRTVLVQADLGRTGRSAASFAGANLLVRLRLSYESGIQASRNRDFEIDSEGAGHRFSVEHRKIEFDFPSTLNHQLLTGA